jgi:hypothetical protein
LVHFFFFFFCFFKRNIAGLKAFSFLLFNRDTANRKARTDVLLSRPAPAGERRIKKPPRLTGSLFSTRCPVFNLMSPAGTKRTPRAPGKAILKPWLTNDFRRFHGLF